jgi:hypothetical protein
VLKIDQFHTLVQRLHTHTHTHERVCVYRGTQIFQNTRSNVKIPGARNATRNNFDTDDWQLLGNTVQNSVARADWHLRFVQACLHTQYKGPFCLLPTGLTKYSMQELHRNMPAICPFIFRLPKKLFMSEGVKINLYKKKRIFDRGHLDLWT